MKTCPRCKTEKPFESFAKNSKRPDGLQSWCRSCNTESRTEWARKNKARIQHHDRYSRYRLTEEEFNQLLIKQDGKCAVCQKDFVQTPRVDHDHRCCETTPTCGNCTRGLLCSRCNSFVGYVETENMVERVYEYLRM